MRNKYYKYKTKEFLIEEYINKGKTTIQIAKEIGAKQPWIVGRWLKEMNIKRTRTRQNKKIYLKGSERSRGIRKSKDSYIGEKYSTFTIIDEIYTPIGTKSVKRLFACQCECGKTKNVTADYLAHIKARSSPCNCDYVKMFQEVPTTYYKSVRSSARRRGLPFDLTIEDFWNIFIKQNRRCSFSGTQLKFESKPMARDATASLDRIDSSKGYIINNIQWVHKYLNIMKQDMPEKEFFEWVDMMYRYRHSITDNKLPEVHPPTPLDKRNCLYFQEEKDSLQTPQEPKKMAQFQM